MTFRTLACIWLFVVASLTPSWGADKVYVVRKNDTLSEIALKYKTTVSALMKRNNLRHADTIRIGQVLRIPSRPAAEARNGQIDPPSELTRVAVRPGKWKHIVIHHSASESATVEGMDRYHRKERHMENGLAYHFVIGNGRGIADGKIAIGRRWTEQLDGGHVASVDLNRTSIGICLVGNFDKHHPTKKQMESLALLVRFLLDRCDLSLDAIETHRGINPIHTRCPGRNFPEKTFLAQMRAALGSKERHLSQK